MEVYVFALEMASDHRKPDRLVFGYYSDEYKKKNVQAKQFSIH